MAERVTKCRRRNGVFTPWPELSSCRNLASASGHSAATSLPVMKQPPLPVPPPPFNAIHARAYQLWQHANRPTGQDVDFWLQAEQQVMLPQAKAPTNTKTPVKRTAKTAAKANPQAALTFKPKSGTKRAAQPRSR